MSYSHYPNKVSLSSQWLQVAVDVKWVLFFKTFVFKLILENENSFFEMSFSGINWTVLTLFILQQLINLFGGINGYIQNGGLKINLTFSSFSYCVSLINISNTFLSKLHVLHNWHG